MSASEKALSVALAILFLPLLVLVGGFVVVAMCAVILLVALVMLGTMIYWVFGGSLPIREDGVVTGTLRWFKFTKRFK